MMFYILIDKQIDYKIEYKRNLRIEFIDKREKKYQKYYKN